MTVSEPQDTKKFIFNTHSNKPINELKEILSQAIDYLNGLDSVSKVFEDQNGFNAFCFLTYAIAYKSKFVYEFLDSKNFVDLLIKIFHYLSSFYNDLNFDKISNLLNAEALIDINEKQAKLFCMFLYTINIYASGSVSFSLNFVTKGGLKCCLNILNDEQFLTKNLKVRVDFFNVKLDLIEFITMNIAGLSKYCDDDKRIWTELDSINILIKIANLKESARNPSYNAILNIADDKQLETLTEMNKIKLLFLGRLEKIAEHFTKNTLRRETRQYIIKGETTNCVIHIITLENGSTMPMLSNLKHIYKLSINEKMRNELYYENNLLKHLKSILSKANYFEIYFVLEIIAQLTFDKKINSELIKDSELNGLLEKFDQKNPNEITNDEEKRVFKSVKTFIEQINWNLTKKIIKTETTSHNKTGHVMISYNAASRPLCLKIKENLEAFGHRVWIDVDDIHGSSLDAMAKAVEDASCVLMCVTEKYRQSVNCQAEAQYAFKLNKMIIPIIMQSGFEPQGWLGLIMGDKIYVSEIIILSSYFL